MAVRAAVDAGEKRHLAQADLSAVRVLEELRRLAFFDYAELFNVDGSLKDIHKMSADARAVLAGSETVIQNVTAGDGKQEWVHKVKTWNKLQALEMLGKHFKLLVEQVDVNVFDWDKLAARLQRDVLSRREL